MSNAERDYLYDRSTSERSCTMNIKYDESKYHRHAQTQTAHTAYVRGITRARRAVEKISSQTVGNSRRSDSQDFLNKKKRERRGEKKKYDTGTPD